MASTHRPENSCSFDDQYMMVCGVYCSLGAGHDGIENSCSFDDQYIMAAYSKQLTDDIFRNSFTFSPCSVAELRVFLHQLATSTRHAPIAITASRTVHWTAVGSLIAGEKGM